MNRPYIQYNAVFPDLRSCRAAAGGGRFEIGNAFRGSSALHAVGDSYLLLTRPRRNWPL